MIFIQRDGVTGDVSFKGDQAQVLDKNGQVVIGWTTGGVIRDVPQGDGYTLQVKTGATVKSDTLAIGSVVFIMGQSNIQRWFDTPSGVPNTSSNTYKMDTDGSIGQVQGSASTYFAQNYAAAGNVPVLMVAAAKGGTALLQANDKGNGYWLDTSAGSLYSTALSQLAKVGGKAEVVLWGQGETDGSGGVTQSDYASGLTTFMNRVLSDFGVSKVLIQEIGPHGSPTLDDKYDAVRAAQHQVADALAGVDIGATTTDLNTIEDGIHLTGASRVLAADRLLDAALSLQGVSYARAVWSGTDSATAGDTYTGTDGRDELRGLAGDDVLSGAGGSDVIIGGDGNDTISGGAGVDLLRGDAGNDTIDGGDDADVISGGDGDDVIMGGAGNDEIWADAGNDIVTGGSGNDYIVGGAGTDTASFSGKFADYTITVSGKTITVLDRNTADGDDGTDLLTDVEKLQFADRLYDPYGSGLPSLFSNSTDYADFATIRAGDYAATSLYNALSGDDEVYLPKDAAAAQAAGYDPSAIFDAGDGDDIVIGGSLNDYIRGGAGNDIINGGGGSDRMEGGTGDDTYYVDTTAVGTTGDLVVEKAGEGTDTVISTATFTLKSNVENLVLVGTAAINGTGNELDNVITGNDATNIINANAGNDTIFGMGGDDQIRGGLGNDTIDGGDGNDTAIFAGPRSGYSIKLGAGTADVTDIDPTDGDEGTDHLSRIELLKFGDSSTSVPLGSAPTGLTISHSSVTEHNAAGSFVGTFSAQDPDAGDTFTYKLLDDAGGRFALNGADLFVAAGTELDHAATPNISLTARVTDLVGHTFDQALTVAIDKAPGQTVTGTDLADKLVGSAGDDVIDGGLGVDTMTGGYGDDTYIVDNSRDMPVEAANGGVDTVRSSVSFTLGANLEKLVLTGMASNATGNALDNTLIGNDRNNILNGGLGNDVMIGGLGNDTYVVDSLGDRFTEDANAGTDTVKTNLNSFSLAVGNNVENLTFVGTGNFQGTGNELANIITGGTGNDFLYGGDDLVRDVLRGGAGDDTYTVRFGDAVTELSNAGHDTIETALAAYKLPANVEDLLFTGSGGFHGTGNELANTVRGGSGNDVLDGGLGADFLIGGAGDDTYVLDSLDDRLSERVDPNDPNSADAGGTDTIQIKTGLTSYSLEAVSNIENLTYSGTSNFIATGNSCDNNLKTGLGNDVLSGGVGHDVLTGGGGADVFLFGSADDGGDTITDFSQSQGDRIGVVGAAFGGLTAGIALPADWLITGTRATSAAHGQFLYDGATQTLSWDGDGTGSATSVKIATFSKPLTLTTADFAVG